MIKEGLSFALAGMAVSWGISVILMRWFSGIAPDVANERSLHQGVVPRIGGIGIVVSFCCLVWVGGVRFPAPWLIALCVVAGVSFLDDRQGLPIVLRLAVQIVVVAVLLEISGVDHLPRTVLLVGFAWLWCVNLFNFMDGADGLAGGMAICAFATLAILSYLTGRGDYAIPCVTVAGAAAGFLVFNFPPAQIFLGDVGSISLGFVYGLMAWWGWEQNLWPWWIPIWGILPFFVDATFTLLRRALGGKPFWRPHREHAYQKLFLGGWSRRQLLVVWYALMIANAAVVVSASYNSLPHFLTALGFFLGLRVVVEVWWARRLGLTETKDLL